MTARRTWTTIGCLLLAVSASRAGQLGTSYPYKTQPTFFVDSWDWTAAWAPEDSQASVGFALGNPIRSGYYYWIFGARASWVRIRHGERDASGVLTGREDDSNGWALGGFGGIGFRPDRPVSLVATLAADRLFAVKDGVGEYYRLKVTTSLGLRFLVSRQRGNLQALRLDLFRASLFGVGDLSDEAHFGVALTWSTARQVRRR